MSKKSELPTLLQIFESFGLKHTGAHSSVRRFLRLNAAPEIERYKDYCEPHLYRNLCTTLIEFTALGTPEDEIPEDKQGPLNKKDSKIVANIFWDISRSRNIGLAKYAAKVHAMLTSKTVRRNFDDLDD